MRTWFKEEIAVLAALVRRPGAGMALLGYLIARMALQADIYVPDWLADSLLAPAAFWMGEAMIAVGAAWFILPEIKGLLAPARAVRPQPESSQAPAHGEAKPV
jgi:hypothetical protein